MPSSSTKALPAGQQLLLQRLMAAHVMTNEDAKKTMVNLQNEHGNEVMGGGERFETLDDVFTSINRQLKSGFGLEIVTMVDRRTGNPPVKYHAVVNLQCDDVAKQQAFEKSYTVHERAFVRLLLRNLLEEETMKRKDCINLRAELDKGFELKLNDAERIIQLLLDEQWLRVSAHQEDDDDDSEDDEDKDDGEVRRRKKRPAKRRRRESVQNKLELAPRTYMELSHYLTGLGLNPDDLPQFLFHRD